MLVLVFRNYEAPLTSYRADPPSGCGALTLMIRQRGFFMNTWGFVPVGPGIHRPGVLEVGRLWPAGTVSLADKAGHEVGIGAFWRIYDGGKVREEYWQDLGVKGQVSATLNQLSVSNSQSKMADQMP
jgi:hypothetical protein